jgi:hypothetical protein
VHAGGRHERRRRAAAAVSAFRLIATLGVAGALAGALIVSVFQWAEPRILHHQAQAIARP